MLSGGPSAFLGGSAIDQNRKLIYRRDVKVDNALGNRCSIHLSYRANLKSSMESARARYSKELSVRYTMNGDLNLLF